MNSALTPAATRLVPTLTILARDARLLPAVDTGSALSHSTFPLAERMLPPGRRFILNTRENDGPPYIKGCVIDRGLAVQLTAYAIADGGFPRDDAYGLWWERAENQRQWWRATELITMDGPGEPINWEQIPDGRYQHEVHRPGKNPWHAVGKTGRAIRSTVAAGGEHYGHRIRWCPRSRILTVGEPHVDAVHVFLG
jgi:hypothetical protein